MPDIIGVITSVEDDEYQGKAHKKVTLGTGDVLKVKYGRDGALKAKWGLLKVGVAIKFIMRDFVKPEGVKVPFVFDIEAVEGALPAPTTPGTAPAGDIPKTATPTRTSNVQDNIEGGMCFKEAGSWLRLWTEHPDTCKLPDYKNALALSYFARLQQGLGFTVTKKEAP